MSDKIITKPKSLEKKIETCEKGLKHAKQNSKQTKNISTKCMK